MPEPEVNPVVDPELLSWARLFFHNFIAGKYRKLRNFNRFSFTRQTALAQVTTPALRSRSSKVRRHAAWIMSMLEVIDDQVVPQLRRMLKDRIHLVRMAAAWAFKELAQDADEAVPDLVACLDDKNEGVVFAVVSALAAFGERAQAAADPLLAMLPTTSTERLRDSILETLSEIAPDDPEVQRLLETELTMGLGDHRFTATLGISKRSRVDDATATKLVANLRDSDPGLVLLTAWTLGKVKPENPDVVPEILFALERVHWMRVDHSELPGQEFVSIRPDFQEALEQTLPATDDAGYEDFRMKFFMYSFHPDPTRKREWVSELANHPWYLKVQRRRFPRAASPAERRAIEEMMIEARQKFAMRLLKNPTLGVDPARYRQLPGFIKNHCRNIAWSLGRSRARQQNAVRAGRLKPAPTSFEPNPAQQLVLMERLDRFIESALPAEQQSVARCRWFNDLTIAETAKLLCITPSQVKTREKQARMTLQKRFTPDES